MAGRSKRCSNPTCPHSGVRYYASQALSISLPFSTYGLDVLAYVGWPHEKEHRQFAEIRHALTARDIQISERHVGRVYRQFLALLGGMSQRIRRRLEQSAHQHGGLIWAIDALQPEGHGTLLYLLYEVLSETPVSAMQWSKPTAMELITWRRPYQELCAQDLSCTVLATLSDGEEAIISALRQCWPKAPHQRCQCHFLSNLAEPVLEEDSRLRQRLRAQLGGLPAVPDGAVVAERADRTATASASASVPTSPPFYPPHSSRRLAPPALQRKPSKGAR